jgi:hypothetical protein
MNVHSEIGYTHSVCADLYHIIMIIQILIILIKMMNSHIYNQYGNEPYLSDHTSDIRRAEEIIVGAPFSLSETHSPVLVGCTRRKSHSVSMQNTFIKYSDNVALKIEILQTS